MSIFVKYKKSKKVNIYIEHKRVIEISYIVHIIHLVTILENVKKYLETHIFINLYINMVVLLFSVNGTNLYQNFYSIDTLELF